MDPPEDRRRRQMDRMSPGYEERAQHGRDQMAIAAGDDPAAFERTMVEVLRWYMRAGRERFTGAYMRGFAPPKIVTFGRYPDTRLAAIFRHQEERGRWIGWSRTIWDPELFCWFGFEPVGQADIQMTYLEEDMEAIGYGPPPRFIPRTVTWYGYQPVTIEEAARIASFPLFLPTDEPADTERTVWITLGTLGGYHREAVCIEWSQQGRTLLSLVEGLLPDLWRARATWQPDTHGRDLMIPATNPFETVVPMVAQTAREGTMIWVDSTLGLDGVAEILQSLERVPGSRAPDPPTSAS
jgi:hypothetical protein